MISKDIQIYPELGRPLPNTTGTVPLINTGSITFNGGGLTIGSTFSGAATIGGWGIEGSQPNQLHLDKNIRPNDIINRIFESIVSQLLGRDIDNIYGHTNVSRYIDDLYTILFGSSRGIDIESVANIHTNATGAFRTQRRQLTPSDNAYVIEVALTNRLTERLAVEIVKSKGVWHNSDKQMGNFGEVSGEHRITTNQTEESWFDRFGDIFRS